MWRANNKINAFTLYEVIVVLILTSIVAGLAFSVLTLVQKQMMEIQENFNRNSELNILEQSLWFDFSRSNKITFEKDENLLRFSTELDTVYYNLNTDYIVKQTDTLRISLKEMTFYFNGNTVEGGKIDALKLETAKPLLNQKLFVFKPNDANQFMD